MTEITEAEAEAEVAEKAEAEEKAKAAAARDEEVAALTAEVDRLKAAVSAADARLTAADVTEKRNIGGGGGEKQTAELTAKVDAAERTNKRLELVNKMSTRKLAAHVESDKKTEEVLSSMRAELQQLRKQHNEVRFPL